MVTTSILLTNHVDYYYLLFIAIYLVATGVDDVANTADDALQAGSGFIGALAGGIGGLAGSLLSGLSTIIEIIVIVGICYCCYQIYKATKSNNSSNNSNQIAPAQIQKEVERLVPATTKGKYDNNGNKRYVPVFRINDDNDSEV
jgi:threonine/homoserine/homoserine lactone efflux protein